MKFSERIREVLTQESIKKAIEIDDFDSCFTYIQQKYKYYNELPDIINFFYKNIPNLLSKMTSIPINFFDKNETLSEFTIPDSIISIKKRAFSASSVSKVFGGHNLISLSNYAFENCQNLTYVDLRDTKIEVLETNTFANCPELKRVYLPKTIRSFDKDVFANSPNVIVVMEYNPALSIPRSEFKFYRDEHHLQFTHPKAEIATTDTQEDTEEN